MKLYHGSNCKIEMVDLNETKHYKDFGKGFYLTPDFQRAVLMANRRTDIENCGEPNVNPFIFLRTKCNEEIKIKEFKSNNWEWAKFVLLNRDKETIPPYQHDYDIVIGPVADSFIDDILKQYKKEYKENFLDPSNLKILAENLKYRGNNYIQYCFCTEAALEYLIRD